MFTFSTTGEPEQYGKNNKPRTTSKPTSTSTLTPSVGHY